MSVKARDLDNPERDLDLVMRETEAKTNKAVQESLVATGMADLKALRERIAAAKVNPGKDPAPHCVDCFRRGWAAAVRAVDG